MLTIGEFSRLSRVTPRMLRHYDALGLLPRTLWEKITIVTTGRSNYPGW